MACRAPTALHAAVDVLAGAPNLGSHTEIVRPLEHLELLALDRRKPALLALAPIVR